MKKNEPKEIFLQLDQLRKKAHLKTINRDLRLRIMRHTIFAYCPQRVEQIVYACNLLTA